MNRRRIRMGCWSS